MLIDDVRQLLGGTLRIEDRVKGMQATAPLLGAVPELDSMAVVSLITALEERFGITVEDDEIDGATFETLGSLAEFVAGKLGR